MGVPTFFRWLTMRNPKIIIDCKQPAQLSQESGNPDIDNFYVDMNGLIHPSCNPQSENIKTPTNFQQQCNNIFEYIDKVMNLIRPKKLVYLAIDGVAPRAKMNQQRSRRFRAAQQQVINEQKKKNLKELYDQRGIYSEQIQDYVNKKSFNSNVITPGTQFLSNVSIALNYYIHNRMNTHPLWKDLIVVFSDANCPGEGQHKIMQFIRQQRACQGYDPNQSHCLYGADADLIMLGLMTHQPQFFIIRETVVQNQQKRCSICGKTGHFFMSCKMGDVFQIQQEEKFAQAINVDFQLISLQLVRDQLHFNFQKSIIPYGYNLQRIVDDFIFMCFFVGNDFLPHLPSLNIRQGGIDVLLYLYEHTLYKMPDYLTNSGIINFKSLQIFLSQLSNLEDTLITEAIRREVRTRQREQNNKVNQPQDQYKTNKKQIEQILTNPLQKFKSQLKESGNIEFNIDNYSEFSHPLMGYKQKFYVQKMRIQPKDFFQFRAKISQSYIQALSWICLYYYRGVASWSWHYPFHYSPFASDILISLVKFKQFQLGTPFKPFQQLMAVFPASTNWAIPKNLQWLMIDNNSPIADFFPQNFKVDLLGKKFAWLGEVLLPFIDQKRLLNAMSNYQSSLTDDQKRRNRLGSNLVFFTVNSNNALKNLRFQKNTVISRKDHNLEGQIKKIQNKQQKIGGNIYSPFTNSWPSIESNMVQCYFYKESEGKPHSIELLPGTTVKPFQINEDYYQKTDKKSFNGQWMIRIIQRLIQKPPSTNKNFESNRRNNPYQNLEQQRGEQKKNTNYQQPTNYNNNNNYNNNYNPKAKYNNRRDRNYQREDQQQKSRSRQHQINNYRGNRDNSRDNRYPNQDNLRDNRYPNQDNRYPNQDNRDNFNPNYRDNRNNRFNNEYRGNSDFRGNRDNREYQNTRDNRDYRDNRGRSNHNNMNEQ